MMGRKMKHLSEYDAYMRQVMKEKQRRQMLPYLLLLPVVFAYILWCYYPFIKSMVLSFTITNARGDIKKWVGIDNYIRIFKSPLTWKILGTTMHFALLNGVGTLTVAMILALICVQKTRFSSIYQTMYALPMAVASVAASTAFTMLFKQEGLVNLATGLTTNWLLNEKTAIYAVAAATIWLRIGVSFLFLLVGFRNVPTELIESSTIDGAGPIRRILYILFPCASPQIFFVIFININGAFKNFAMIRQLTGGGPNESTRTMIYEIYQDVILKGRLETACAKAIILGLIIVFFQRLQFRFEDKLVVY